MNQLTLIIAPVSHIHRRFFLIRIHTLNDVCVSMVFESEDDEEFICGFEKLAFDPMVCIVSFIPELSFCSSTILSFDFSMLNIKPIIFTGVVIGTIRRSNTNSQM
jgi:hypothetical protein